MATFYAGKDASIVIGSGSDVLPGLVSFTLPESQARIDVTTAGNSRESFILGLKPGTATADAYLDTSLSALESAITSGTTVEVSFQVDGDEIDGFIAYVLRAINTQSPTGAVKATYTFVNAA